VYSKRKGKSEELLVVIPFSFLLLHSSSTFIYSFADLEGAV
jgi:hypothetical protein